MPTSRAQNSSVASSPTPGIPASPDKKSGVGSPESGDEGLRAACADALDELKAARKLIAAQQVALDKDAQLAGLQGQIETGLKNLRQMDAEEKQHLRDAIAASQRQIAALEAEVSVLKKQRMTWWKKAKWFVIGGAAGVIAGAVLGK